MPEPELRATKSTFKAGEERAVVEIKSHRGHKAVFTITTDGYSLIVSGRSYNFDGTPVEDSIGLFPIDQNTMGMFI